MAGLVFRWGLFKCPSCFSCACYQERCRLVLGIFQNDRALPAAAPLHSNPESEGGHPSLLVTNSCFHSHRTNPATADATSPTLQNDPPNFIIMVLSSSLFVCLRICFCG